ncbi:5057_t:CDS:1 [Diversispora eburnea]|uniref:5057_t:CDS:1 n=1 Tax=Diversispora eburnea TaxID=1213867 RepID=A0A9N8ZQ91_9GLOM|nr:5057_t:CDS:1 [Diversispora eburnea]
MKSLLLPILIIFGTLYFTTFTNGTPIRRDDKPPRTAVVESGDMFCIFLPKDYGGNIGESESTAIAACTHESPNAYILPAGFIVSAHFKEDTGYVQVTGVMNGSIYGLSPTDSGGQYDMKAPPNSVCEGYSKFVNLVEPDVNHYCIRCCNDTSKCDTGDSEKGCEYVIPGNYSG